MGRAVISATQKFKSLVNKENSPRLIQSPQPRGIAGKMRSMMRRTDFDIYLMTGEDVINCAVYMFEDYGLLKILGITNERFRAFVLELRVRHSVTHPYTSWKNSVATCQMIYVMMSAGGAAQFLSPNDLFGVMVAALSLGVDHSGKIQPLLVHNEEELQQLLIKDEQRAIGETPENMVQKIIKIGSQDHCHIFGGLSGKTLESISGAMEAAFQGTLLKRMAVCITENTPDVCLPTLQASTSANPLRFNMKKKFQRAAMGAVLPSREERRRLVSWLLYCAFLNYPARSTPIAKRIAGLHHEQCWKAGDAIIAEADAEADDTEGEKQHEEKHVPECFQRIHSRDSPVFRATDLGYTDFIVAPAFTYLTQQLPGMRSVLYNIARWRASLCDSDASADGIDRAVCAMQGMLKNRQHLHRQRAAAALKEQQLQEEQMAAARRMHEQAEKDRMEKIISGDDGKPEHGLHVKSKQGRADFEAEHEPLANAAKERTKAGVFGVVGAHKARGRLRIPTVEVVGTEQKDVVAASLERTASLGNSSKLDEVLAKEATLIGKVMRPIVLEERPVTAPMIMGANQNKLRKTKSTRC